MLNMVLVVIDNLDEEDETKIIILQNVIDLVKKEENRMKMRLILSGRCNFFYKKQMLYLKDELSTRNVNNLEMFLYYNIKLTQINETDKNNDMNSLPLSYFNKNIPDSIKNNMIKKEEECCKKLNDYGIYYCIFNEGKNINISDIETYYKILPIDYIVFNKNDNNIISFKFHNEIFKSACKKHIEFSIQSDHFTYILKSFDKNRITFGIFEEKILTLLLSYNKLKLSDLIFEENNRLEVYEIFQFQISAYGKTKKIYDKKKPIIITQENYLGENYDLLILIPMPLINCYKAYFIQIGTNKTKTQINTIKNDLSENELKYKNGIKKFIGCDIINLTLIFIFDKDTQVGLIEKEDFSGAQYCIDNNIIFFVFSIEDFRLYSSHDLKEFFINDKFEQFKSKITHKRTYNEPKNYFSFFSFF